MSEMAIKYSINTITLPNKSLSGSEAVTSAIPRKFLLIENNPKNKK